MTEKHDIHELLKRFQILWNKSLDGDYSHHAELASLAKSIKKIKTTNNLYSLKLTTTEIITLNHALIISNL